MKKIVAFLFSLVSFSLLAQVGGIQSYTYLLMPNDAKIGAIGGINVSTAGTDIAMIGQNPAALSDTMSNRVGFTYRNLYADIGYNNFVGAISSPKIGGAWGLSVSGISYGDFDEYDHLGNNIGTFRASENVIALTKSHKLGNISMGLTAKFASSKIASYKSNALLFDIGGQFQHPTKELIVGLVMKNAGLSLKHYREDLSNVLPLDLQLGASYKFEHAPLRLSLQVHNLTRYDLQYLDSTRNVKIDEDGNEISEQEKTSERIARHFVIGTELLLAKGLHVRVGYNHMMRKELKADPLKGGAGFSFGFMLKVSALDFNFTRVYYHLQGGSTMLAVNVDVNKFYKKKS